MTLRTKNHYIVKIDEELRELVPPYLENKKRELPQFWEALKKRDFEFLQRAGHRLKGSAGGYGFDFICELAERMEQMAVSKHISELEKILNELEDHVFHIEIKFETLC